MVTAIFVVVVVGFVLALAAGLLYYKSKAQSSENIAAVTELAKDVAEDRAVRSEDSVAKRNQERYAEALENAKHATLSIALRNWADAGKLWRKDPDSGAPGDPGAVPSGKTPAGPGR